MSFARPAKAGYEWVRIHDGPHKGEVVEVAEGCPTVRLAYRLPLPRFIAEDDAPVSSAKTSDFIHEYKRIRLAENGYLKGQVWLPAEWNDNAIAHWLRQAYGR